MDKPARHAGKAFLEPAQDFRGQVSSTRLDMGPMPANESGKPSQSSEARPSDQPLDFHAVDTGRQICPYAPTVLAWSEATQEIRMFTHGCRKWHCEICGPRRKASLVRKIVAAAPNRMLTLTSLHEGDRVDRHQRMARALPRLATTLRSTFGPLEYIRMTEACADGYPHFHLLARSAFLPQQRIKELWQKLTDAYIVDVRKAHGKSIGYVAKYITKARNETGEFSRQRISVSKNFWVEENNIDECYLGWEHKSMHPSDYVKLLADHKIPNWVRTSLYEFADREPGDEIPYEFDTRTVGVE